MTRNIALDILKMLMAFMVVGIHSKFLFDINLLSFYISVNGIFRIAVPIFFMITGFYFYQVLESNSSSLWLKRIFTLYVFWMAVYSWFWFPNPELSFSYVKNVLIVALLGYHHLWYVSGLIGAALLTMAVRNKPLPVTVSLMTFAFLLGVIFQYLGNYHYFAGGDLDYYFNRLWFHRNAVFVGFPFFFCGYLIKKHSIHSRFTMEQLSLFCVLGIIFLLCESIFNFYQIGQNTQVKNYGLEVGFDSYISLAIVCPFIFILFSRINIVKSSKLISLNSSAIYFIHPLILYFYKELTDINSALLTIATISSSFLAAFFIIKANNKLKFLL